MLLSEKEKKRFVLIKSKFRIKAKSQLNERVVFFHVPKTGGTSVSNAIMRSYGIYENIVHKRTKILNAQQSIEASINFNLDLDTLRQTLLKYWMSGPKNMYISGHFNFSQNLLVNGDHKWKFITLFRDPIERWFSHYFFNNTINSGCKNDSSDSLNNNLNTFLRSSKNRATHMGASYVTGLTNKNFSSELIEEAKNNLSYFDLLGIVEDVPTFESMLRYKYGVRINVKYINKNKKKPRYMYWIDPCLLDEVKNICSPNINIYEHVLRIYK